MFQECWWRRILKATECIGTGVHSIWLATRGSRLRECSYTPL